MISVAKELKIIESKKKTEPQSFFSFYSRVVYTVCIFVSYV